MATEVETTNNRVRSQRTKLTLGDLGAPAIVKTMTPEQLRDSGGKHILGYLVGKARDFVERTDPKTNEKFEGLAGSFVMIPADKDREELESGVLFIPDAFHNLVADKLRALRTDDTSAQVEFAFEVSSIPAKNPAGYSWDFKPAIPFEGKHPLDDTLTKMTKQLAVISASKQKSIAGPATGARK